MGVTFARDRGVCDLVWPTERHIGAVIGNKVASGLVCGRITGSRADNTTVVALETGAIGAARTGKDAANNVHKVLLCVNGTVDIPEESSSTDVYHYTDIAMKGQYFMSILL